jgi:hypothetical protein
MTRAPAKTNDAWTEYETPWVTEDTGVPFRYFVESLSEPGMTHTVDLTQRGGHGACTCTHFRLVANPNFRRHQQWIPYAPKRQGVSECKHIRAAWDYYHLNVTVPLMNRLKNGIPSP